MCTELVRERKLQDCSYSDAPIPHSKSLVVSHRLDYRFFLMLCLVVNGIFIWGDAYGTDMAYWVSWTKSLKNGGYEAFNGNYPPVYVHWLYLCSHLAEWNLIELSNNLKFKFVTFFPVILAHLSLIRLVAKLLIESNASYRQQMFALTLACVNPAFIMDGPVWGQVDILPTVICAWSLYCALHARLHILVIPIFMLSLLTKFQMICVSPVIGAIFFSNIRAHFVGAVLSLAVFFVVYLPFIIENNFTAAFGLAYLDTLGQYPVTSLNAANLQLLIFGNEVSDGISLFEDGPPLLGHLSTLKNLGMLSYALFSLVLMLRLIYLFLVSKATRVNIITFAALSGVMFFMVLPGMHERYLVPGVVLAVLAAAVDPRLLVPAILLSFLSAINIGFILPLRGEMIWKAVALVSALAVIPFFVLAFWPDHYYRVKRFLLVLAKKTSIVARYGILELISVCVLVVILSVDLDQPRPPFDNPLASISGVSLTNLPVISQNQDWGKLKVNAATNGKPLTVDGYHFTKGFGIHANSEIVFDLDKKYREFHFMYALDDFSKGGLVRFKVIGDGRLLWQSRKISRFSPVRPQLVNVGGVKELKLIVDGLDSINDDHADWLYPVLVERPGTDEK